MRTLASLSGQGPAAAVGFSPTPLAMKPSAAPWRRDRRRTAEARARTLNFKPTRAFARIAATPSTNPRGLPGAQSNNTIATLGRRCSQGLSARAGGIEPRSGNRRFSPMPFNSQTAFGRRKRRLRRRRRPSDHAQLLQAYGQPGQQVGLRAELPRPAVRGIARRPHAVCATRIYRQLCRAHPRSACGRPSCTRPSLAGPAIRLSIPSPSWRQTSRAGRSACARTPRRCSTS